MFGHLIAASMDRTAQRPGPAAGSCAATQPKTDLFFAHIKRVFAEAVAGFEQSLAEQDRLRAEEDGRLQAELLHAVSAAQGGEARRQQQAAVTAAAMAALADLEDSLTALEARRRGPSEASEQRIATLVEAIRVEDQRAAELRKRLADLQTLAKKPYVHKRQTFASFKGLSRF